MKPPSQCCNGDGIARARGMPCCRFCLRRAEAARHRDRRWQRWFRDWEAREQHARITAGMGYLSQDRA